MLVGYGKRWFRTVIAATITLAVVLIAVPVISEQVCHDPPDETWVQYTLTLTEVNAQKPVADELSDSELIFIVQVTPLGSCNECVQTYVRYLEIGDVSLDPAGKYYNITLDEPIYQIKECWPPSTIVVECILIEEDFLDDSEVWRIVSQVLGTDPTAVKTVLAMTGKPDKDPDAGWSIRVQGGFLDALVAKIDEEILVPKTRQEYGPVLAMGPHRQRPREFKTSMLSYNKYKEVIMLWQLHHDYDYPPGSCLPPAPPPAEAESGKG